MGRYECSIKIAFDKISGQILDADIVFDTKKDAFEIRKKYHEKNLILSCCECEQDLMVSGSKYDRLHFKHKPGHDYCILADGQLSPQDYEKFIHIAKSKESNRHKELKNKIGELLTNVHGVDISTISIDKKFIIRENDKRRPDVYCKYYDKDLVFEIQLSDLPLSYILSRVHFYKKHGMYLIWILDNFNIHSQGTLERDIKYLTKYENFFKLDEKSETFQLECEYKFPFLTKENNIITKWLKKSISLSQIKFDNVEYQIFYYNYGDNKLILENTQREIDKEIKETEKKRLDEVRLLNANSKVKHIISKIKNERSKKIQNYHFISHDISQLNKYELHIFNSTLDLKNKKTPLTQWISSASQDDIQFIEFILGCKGIELDVNEKNSNEKTPFKAILSNKTIHRFLPMKCLFQAGYKLSDLDRKYLSEIKGQNCEIDRDAILYCLCNDLTDRTLVNLVFHHSKLLFIIESAKRQEIIGFNYKKNEWKSFANNAIQYYSEYWEYIELALKEYEVWDMIIQDDKRNIFEKKVELFYSQMPEQKYDFDEIFKDLYPEIAFPY